MTASATYVYCLLRSEQPPSLEGAPAGLARTGQARLLDVGERRWLVVADAPLQDYGAEAIDRGLRDLQWVGQRAVEHEHLVEHFLGSGTVLPMKLFTLYFDDARACADVRRRAREIGALLDALEGKQEWGVRVLVDRIRAAREPAETGEGAEARSAGHAFLLRKQRLLDAGRERRGELRERAEELYQHLARRASDARSRPPTGGGTRLVLDASFLVPKASTDEFQAAVRARAQALAPHGLEIALSGPWPAYNFVELEP